MGEVEKACRHYLTGLPPDVAASPLAMSALVLARIMDDDSTAATAHALCHKAFSDSLDKLRALAPAEVKEAKVDELKSRRAARRARGAGSKG